MDDESRILEQDFCPPLDPALVSAIYSDFAGQDGGAQLARGVLEGLKQAAAAEQLTEFDPSGSSGGAVKGVAGKGSRGLEDVESNTETLTSRTTDTDSTSLSGEATGGTYFKDTELLDTPTKELLLAETFPTLRLELVAYTLKKCGGDFANATDELLNHVYFEEERASPTEVAVAKGIDAFSEEHHKPQRGKKGKRRKQKVALYGSDPVSPFESDSCSTATNKWADGGRNVDFIASRTNVSTAAVASIYHENGASLAGTIIALIKKDITAHEKEKEPEASLVQPASELSAEFSNIDFEHAIALIRLTAPSTANAHELAKALTVSPLTTSTLKGGIQVIPRYAPIDLSDPTPDSPSPSANLPSLAPSATPRTTASLAAARSSAFTQASSAYRRGKSTPLMKAAAGYYSQVGRDLTANLHALSEADADALVASQSSPTVLDLHGVSVQSATRIARARTQDWWDGLGEERIAGGGRGKGVAEGFRIVTGLGRHSEGGRGKLGPAVVRALVGGGWKVEVGSGEVVVTGVARRR